MEEEPEEEPVEVERAGVEVERAGEEEVRTVVVERAGVEVRVGAAGRTGVEVVRTPRLPLLYCGLT